MEARGDTALYSRPVQHLQGSQLTAEQSVSKGQEPVGNEERQATHGSLISSDSLMQPKAQIVKEATFELMEKTEQKLRGPSRKKWHAPDQVSSEVAMMAKLQTLTMRLKVVNAV